MVIPPIRQQIHKPIPDISCRCLWESWQEKSTAMKIQIRFISNDAQTHKKWLLQVNNVQCLWLWWSHMSENRPDTCDDTQPCLNRDSLKRRRILLHFWNSLYKAWSRQKSGYQRSLLCVYSCHRCLLQSARLHKLLCNLLPIISCLQQPAVAISYQL